MSIVLKTFLLLILLLQIIMILHTVKKKKFSIKYACFWISMIFILVLIVIFPNFVFKLSNIAGFEEPSNMVFLLGFFFLFYIIFILTSSISIQNEKIKVLIQEVSLLKERIDNNGKKE